jgi:hypothetical protein
MKTNSQTTSAVYGMETRCEGRRGSRPSTVRWDAQSGPSPVEPDPHPGSASSTQTTTSAATRITTPRQLRAR